MTQPPLPQLHQPRSTPACCLCGLLCPLPMKWPDQDEPPACARLHAWLNIQDTHAEPPGASPRFDQLTVEPSPLVQSASTALQNARRPLIWLESADVETTRAAVALAQVSGATLHVAQSPGAELAAHTAATDGWLGTTLGEVGSTAAVVIHLGQQHLRDAPMLELRFVNPTAQHIFINGCPESLLIEPQLQDSIIQLHWPKETWLDRFSRTLLLLRDESSALDRRADAVDSQASMLAEWLLGSRYTVILWGEDELADELDGLIVHRLLELARQVSRTTRCSLLCLAQDPGRVTAKDSILWLTNRTTPVRYVDGRWIKELPQPHSLEQWQQTFDWIVCVRTLPSDRPLPELRFDLVLDAHCNLASAESMAGDTHPRIPVQAVGLDASGHLLRADHGLAAFLPAINTTITNAPTNGYLSAATLLQQLTDLERVPQSPATRQGTK